MATTAPPAASSPSSCAPWSSPARRSRSPGPAVADTRTDRRTTPPRCRMRPWIRRRPLPGRDKFRRERPAMGVTQEHPLCRKTAGFQGRSRHYTRRITGAAAPAEGRDRSSERGGSGATTRRARCDSGCDRGSSSESHRGAANRPPGWRASCCLGRCRQTDDHRRRWHDDEATGRIHDSRARVRMLRAPACDRPGGGGASRTTAGESSPTAASWPWPPTCLGRQPTDAI